MTKSLAPASQEAARLATPIPIDDPDDPRIAVFRHVRERDLAGRVERFILEGDVVLRQALRHGRFPLECVLLSRRRLENDPALAASVPDTVPLLVADDAVMSRIVGFDIHRGVLAAGIRRGDLPLDEALAALPDQATVLVCVGIANHDNMGGIFRNAAAFGASLVLLDGTSCDPLYRKAIRVSVGAAVTVPFQRGNDARDIVHALIAARFQVLAMSPSGEQTLSTLPPSSRVALVLGAEGPGLPADVLAAAIPVRLQMSGDLDSLNVATASGIALHAIFNR
jgi:tRNA G18 (ribose-2'-O)-methylase SpoU